MKDTNEILNHLSSADKVRYDMLRNSPVSKKTNFFLIEVTKKDILEHVCQVDRIFGLMRKLVTNATEQFRIMVVDERSGLLIDVLGHPILPSNVKALVKE